MNDSCAGRVVIVTGAGRGIGRAEALEFGRQGARVVVNDLGVERSGQGPRSGLAEEVAAQIRADGGVAIANGEDVSDWDGARRMVDAALESFGDLHVLVNNAGILRDRMLVNMSPDEWDAVVRVHLRGTFCPTRHAAVFWRSAAKAGHAADARIINTTSRSGLFGNVGQANYGAAKAGIAGLTIIAAMELERYGVMVNAVSPTSLTRMTEDRPFSAAARELRAQRPEAFNDLAPDNIAPLVVWLGTRRSRGITGRVFNIRGGYLSVLEGWAPGPHADKDVARWEVDELDDVIPRLVGRARANTGLSG
jgi:NAD(P)-dependent dehydrogenase (short-subunit alcohol dehydrogenase family)